MPFCLIFPRGDENEASGKVKNDISENFKNLKMYLGP